MKNKLKRVAALLMCASMAMCFAGCGESYDSETESVEPESESGIESESGSESEAPETTEVVFLNESGRTITNLIVMPEDCSYEAVSLNDEDLEDGYMLFADIEIADCNYTVEVYCGADKLYGDAMDNVTWDLNNNGVMVFPESYAGEAMVYPGSWGDVDEALAAANEALGIVNEEETEADESDGIEPDADTVNAFLTSEGFDGTLADYRLETHDFLYYDEYLDAPTTYPELVAYWYPEGNMNSAFYFAINENGTFYFYRFGASGDELESYCQVKSRHGEEYTLEDGQVFTLNQGVSLFYEEKREITLDGIVYHASGY